MTAFEEIKKKQSKEDLKLIIKGLSEKVKNLKESIEDYTTAIRMNPNYSEAYNNRGKAKMDLSETEKALEFYQDVLANYDLGE